MADWISGLIGGAANIAGGITSGLLNYKTSKDLAEQQQQYYKENQAKAQEYNVNNMAIQKEYSKELTDYENAINIRNKLNQYTLERQALEAAGYNPLLALDGGQGVSAAQGASAPSGGATQGGTGGGTSFTGWDQLGNGIGEAGNMFDLQKREAEIENIKSQTRANDKNISKTDADISKINAEKDKIYAEMPVLKEQIPLIKAQTKEIGAKIQNLNEDTRNKLEQTLRSQMGQIANTLGTEQVLALYSKFGKNNTQLAYNAAKILGGGAKAIGTLAGFKKKWEVASAAAEKLLQEAKSIKFWRGKAGG